MSKCDIQIQFDRPNRMYRGGDTVTGKVTIDVNENVKCNGIVLTYYWKTHGKGNRDKGEEQEFLLARSCELKKGEKISFPFSFVSDLEPLTYHGHLLNVDHYAKVHVDVPWAFDPKHEEEFILIPGKFPSHRMDLQARTFANTRGQS